MPSYLFSNIVPSHLSKMKLRLSIFLITGAIMGLPALVWAVRVLYHHRKKGHHISAFIKFLLINDLFELLLSPYIVTKLLSEDQCWNTDGKCRVFTSLWWTLSVFGLLLNQMVALEGVLSMRHPLCSAHIFSSPCLIIFFILIFVCFFITDVLFTFVFCILTVYLVLAVSVVTCIVSCRAVPSNNHHSYTSRKADRHVLAVSIFTLLVIYLPLMSLHIVFSFTLYDNYVWYIPLCLMCLRLILDPLLCVLVCRQNLSIQTPQTTLFRDQFNNCCYLSASSESVTREQRV